MTTVNRATENWLHARLLLVAFCGLVGCCVAATLSAASTIGVSFTGATTPANATDGVDVLNIQTQHPVSSAGFIDSYTFLGTTAGLGDPFGDGPYNYDFMIFRPTGTTNQYTVVYDSGAQQPTTVGLQTVDIAPVAVLPGDVIGDYGRGISFDIPGPDASAMYSELTIAPTPPPSGTFTAGDEPYPQYFQTRTYYVQANFTTVPVPEPSSAVLALLGLAACGAARAWRRRRSA